MKRLYILLFAMVLMTGANAQWVLQNSGTIKTLRSVYFTAENIGYAVGDSGTILKTNDCGENWEIKYSGTSNNLYSVHFTYPDIGFAVGDSGTILKTIDGGENWELKNSGTLNSLRSVDFPGYMTGYAVGGNSILKTINAGENWVSLDSLSIVHNLNSVYFIDTITGFAAGGGHAGWDIGALIIKTINGGADWNTSFLYTSPTFYCNFKTVYFIDSQFGYASGYASGMFGWYFGYITTDGGINWTLGCALMSVNSFHFPGPDIGYAVGPFGEIAKTFNGGTDWILQSSGTTKTLKSVYFTDSEIGCIVGDSGLILTTTNGGITSVIEHDVLSLSLAISPNPSNDKVTISLPLSKGNIMLSIFNVSKEKVMEMQLADNETQIDISTLPRGVYVVRVWDERGVFVEKLIKQ